MLLVLCLGVAARCAGSFRIHVLDHARNGTNMPAVSGETAGSLGPLWKRCMRKAECNGVSSHRVSGMVCPVPATEELHQLFAEKIKPATSHFRDVIVSLNKLLVDVLELKGSATFMQRAVEGTMTSLKELDLAANLADNALLEETASNAVSDLVTHLQNWHGNVTETISALDAHVKYSSSLRSSTMRALADGKTAFCFSVISTWKPWIDAGVAVASQERGFLPADRWIQHGCNAFAKLHITSMANVRNIETVLLDMLRDALRDTNDLLKKLRSTQSIHRLRPDYFQLVAMDLISHDILHIFKTQGNWLNKRAGLVDELAWQAGDLSKTTKQLETELTWEARQKPDIFIEIKREVIERLLWKDIPEVFLGLESCFDCAGTSSPALTLEYFTTPSMQGSFCFRAAAPACLKNKTVCACYGARGLFARSHVRNIGCSHMLVNDTSEKEREVETSFLRPNDVRDAPWRKMAPLRACVLTWNIGSEWKVGGMRGVGAGGVDGRELRRNLRRLIREGCGEEHPHDLIALTLQEVSEPKVVDYVKDLLSETWFIVSNGMNWSIAGYAFAKAFDSIPQKYQGYNSTKYLHALPQGHGYANGVFVLVASKLHAVQSASFSVDILGSSFWSQGRAALAGMMGSTGDKGAAVLKISIDRTLAGRRLEFCFVGSHLDASSESTRGMQTRRIQAALKVIDCPDGTWWAGDFNPRLQEQCCPWDRIQLYMHHGLRKAMVNTVLDLDPVLHGTSWRKQEQNSSQFTLSEWECSGEDCGRGWHELPIGFAPTFHKRYHREGRDWTQGTCTFKNYEEKPHVRLVDSSGLVGRDRLADVLETINVDNEDNIASWSNKSAGRDACPKVAQKTLCWDGLYTFEGCQEWGLCYYTSHCPLYTDRILFTSGVRTEISNRNQMHVVGRRYDSLPHLTTADHNPVIASFSVTFH